MLVALALTLAACSHGFDGPTPVISSVGPIVVCNAIDTTVNIKGTGFTPVPENVLNQSTLVLPTVSLVDASGNVFPIAAADVTWIDETMMSFVVRASSMYAPGIYDVMVTDPTGKSGVLKAGLTIVPPPTITSVTPNPINNGADTTITVAGTGFRMTPTVTISMGTQAPTMLGSVTFVDAQTVTAVVARGTPAGMYTLTLTNPDGCFATITITVINPPSITVTGIINPFGCNTQDTPVTISGSMFVSTPQAVLIGAATGSLDLKLRNVSFVSSTKLTGLVPMGGVIGGPYPLKVTNPDGSFGTLDKAFTITKLCPPVITSVIPNSVVHNYSTATSGPIKITGDNFRSDARVVLVDNAGVETMFPGAAVTVVDGQHITLNFDASASNLTDGIYLVRVKEADASVANGGTGDMMWGDYSLFIVTPPSGKFTTAKNAKPLPLGRRGLGAVGGENNAAARYLYAIAGDGGGTTATLFADGMFAQLDLFGNIGDLGWQTLRKSSTTSPPVDTTNALPSARTGVAIVNVNNWIYLVGGTTALATGAGSTPSAPIADIRRAHILSAADAPLVTSTTAAGGTLATGTWYYKVSMLISATPGYGFNAAETVASDEEVVSVIAGQSPQLNFSRPAGSSVPAGNIIGYRIYRAPMVNGVSQSEVWLADVSTTAASGTFTDDGSKTPGTAHPLAAGMLSEWEPAGSNLLIPRAYPAVSVATPPTATAPNLYVLGGVSAGGATPTVEKTWELSTIAASGALGTFGPTGLLPTNTSTVNCALSNETCMTTPRSALFASTVTGPPAVTTDVRLVVGAGSTTAGKTFIEEESQVQSNGFLGAWVSVPLSGPSASFTGGFESVQGPVGFYYNGHVGLSGGYTGTNVFSHDEFAAELCSTAASSCPANTTFTQQSPVSNSGLNATLTAWSGFAITSGDLFIVGGSTDGTNAVTTVQQGAQ